ncbi:MAG TPA: OmpH family outer membrane protein [Puia sp.]|nr:OmpH family outer membrane protein [Puia sp.]
MKKIFLLILPLISIAFISVAQVGFVNTKYILEKMPEYRDAEKLISQIGNQWQREIDNKQTILTRMNADYESERPLLSDDIKKKREENLAKMAMEIRDLQRNHFGYDGDLAKKEDTLTKPLRERINNAIQKISVVRRYQIVLDKSEGITVMFSDPKLDISDDVLRELGIR